MAAKQGDNVVVAILGSFLVFLKLLPIVVSEPYFYLGTLVDLGDWWSPTCGDKHCISDRGPILQLTKEITFNCEVIHNIHKDLVWLVFDSLKGCIQSGVIEIDIDFSVRWLAEGTRFPQEFVNFY